MKEEELGQEPAFPMKLNQVIGQTRYNFPDENGNGQIGYYNNYADIIYLNQLQNLFFDLTGEELEVEL